MGIFGFASKGKARYEKYCAPLLHLAGIKVALVKTEHEDQAKQIMDVIDNTSAVVVAGGDGTLSEVSCFSLHYHFLLLNIIAQICMGECKNTHTVFRCRTRRLSPNRGRWSR